MAQIKQSRKKEYKHGEENTDAKVSFPQQVNFILRRHVPCEKWIGNPDKEGKDPDTQVDQFIAALDTLRRQVMIDGELVQVLCNSVKLESDQKVQLKVHDHGDAGFETICEFAGEVVALTKFDWVYWGHDRADQRHSKERPLKEAEVVLSDQADNDDDDDDGAEEYMYDCHR